ncbi:rhamnogalacturonan acetylesterase [Mucilaginibacter sp. AW1-3]
MKKISYRVLPLVALLCICAAFMAPPKPVFYIIGDSTVRNPNPPWCSWGQVIHNYFDTTRISISNQAIAGRSTRQFINEGRWQRIVSTIKPGDFLLVEFGHNEGGKPDTGKTGRRAVLKDIGEDSVIVNYDKGPEVVHTYGWYLRKFATEAKAKGATVMIASMIASNVFKDGKVVRADKTYGLWARQVAEQTGSYFIDANNLIADKFEKMGPEMVKGVFPYDPVHTNAEGAGINAGAIVTAIKKDSTNTLNKYFAVRKF